MTFRSVLLPRVGVCALLLAAPVVSRADTIVFTNLGAGLTYNTGAANFVGNAFDGNLYGEGNTFTPTINSKLSSIDIALSCMFSGGCPDTFTVSLETNSGDAPSTILENFFVTGTSLGLLGSNNAPIVLTSILKPTLANGTQYWVTVTSDINDSIGWNLNSTVDANDEAISTNGGLAWFSPSGLTPGAYEVNGATTTTITPEPSSLGLMFIGLLSLAAGRRFGVRGWRTSKAD
jgi:hypothetical protein